MRHRRTTWERNRVTAAFLHLDQVGSALLRICFAILLAGELDLIRSKLRKGLAIGMWLDRQDPDSEQYHRVLR